MSLRSLLLTAIAYLTLSRGPRRSPLSRSRLATFAWVIARRAACATDLRGRESRP